MSSAMSSAMSSVLIIRPSSLGDIVHALPVVHDIRQHRPGMSVDWVAEEMFVELVALNREVRAVIPVSLRRWRHALLARATWREIAAFRGTLRAQRYDVVLDLQEQVKGAFIGAFARGAVHGPDRASIREPVATLAYRRKRDRENLEPVIQVAAKLAVFHHQSQISVSGGNQAEIHVKRARAPKPFKLLLLQDSQQFGLQLERNVADLI